MATRPFQLPAYEYPQNAMINFAPLNTALGDYTKGIKEAGVSTAQINAANAMQAGNYDLAASETARSGDVSGAMALRRHPLEVRGLEDAQRDRETRRIAGQIQGITSMADGPERVTAWTNWLNSDPRHRAAVTASGLDPNDHVRTPNAILSEALGPQDPVAQDLRRAQTEQARAHGRLYDAQSTTAGQNKPPSGFEWIDPRNQSLGLRAIPGGPGTHISAEVAGRLAMMQMARVGVSETRAIYERAWGAGDFARQGAANIPFVGDLAIASGDQGIAQRNIRVAVEAALRTMTGAAAPETEVTRYMAMFTPGSRDTVQSAKQKLDALDSFMENAHVFATQGRTSTPPPANRTVVQPPPQSTVPEGATATNPQTGQRIIFRNGQWQPL